eukprot:14212199-Alexandrium_andersonii.AAC.1
MRWALSCVWVSRFTCFRIHRTLHQSCIGPTERPASAVNVPPDSSHVASEPHAPVFPSELTPTMICRSAL